MPGKVLIKVHFVEHHSLHNYSLALEMFRKSTGLRAFTNNVIVRIL